MKHIIPLEMSQTFNDPNIFSTPREFEIHFTDNPNKYGQYTTFSIFGWNEKTAQRKVYQGRDGTLGPYATMSANGAMITAHKQKPKERLEVSLADTLEIDGVEYSIKMDRYGYVKLTIV